MRKLALVGSAISAVLITNVGQAFSLVGSSSATWNLPQSPTQSTTLSESNSRLSWGRIDSCGACTQFNNSLKFEGINFTASNNPFQIGNISFRNGTVWDGALGDFGLTLNLFIDNESETFHIPFSVLNTPNITGNPILDGDKLRLGTTTLQQFDNNGAKYSLELVGFSINYSREFNAPESTIATTGLYARMSEIEPKKINEPSLILGLLMLGGYLVVSKRKQ